MDSYTDDVSLLPESRTRKQYIDPVLKKQGWRDKHVKEEVNSVKSDFKHKRFVFFDGKPERGVDRFIDYLLLDWDYSPLAIIEAKVFW